MYALVVQCCLFILPTWWRMFGFVLNIMRSLNYRIGVTSVDRFSAVYTKSEIIAMTKRFETFCLQFEAIQCFMVDTDSIESF